MKTIGTVLFTVVLADKHPVRQEIVDEIKAGTNAWWPREIHENHLRHVPVEKIPGKTGNLGNYFSDGVSKFTKTVV